jgi:hypothetical protein
MLKTSAYAAVSAKTRLTPFAIERRKPAPQDVLIDILFFAASVIPGDVRYRWKEES